MGKRVLVALAAALLVAPLMMSGVAHAVSPTPTPRPSPALAGVLSNNYFSNVDVTGLEDGTVRIVNNSQPSLCALIYVTDKDQEMRECCGCRLSDKSTRILSVDSDLADNPANGVLSTDGSIAIISSASTNCDPALPKPTPQLEAWATHPQLGGFLTEDEFTPLPATATALADLTAECAAIELIGSGKGVCTCGTGD